MAESKDLQAKELTLSGDHKVSGRPTMLTDDLAAFICGRIAEGQTLTAICKTPGLPARATVHRWRRENSQFALDYQAARADQMEGWSDDIVDIADDDTLDTLETFDKKGNAVTMPNHANVQRDRLRISTRQFLMAKIAHHTYGDRVQHEHGGEIGHRVTVQLSDRERMRRLATFMLEDKAAGVTIEQAPEQATEPVVAESQPEKPASVSPADIVSGINNSPVLNESDE